MLQDVMCLVGKNSYKYKCEIYVLVIQFLTGHIITCNIFRENMKFKIFLFLFFFAFFIIDNSYAKVSFGRGGGRVGGRSSYGGSRGGSSGTSSTRISHGTPHGGSHGTPHGGSHGTSNRVTPHETSSGRISHGTSSGAGTLARSSSDFLKAEGGGATKPVVSPSTIGQGRSSGVVTESKQTSPFQPSAPQERIMKSSAGSLQNQGNQQGQTYPSWSNPHLNDNKPIIPGQTHVSSSNSHPGINKPTAPVPEPPPIGFKDHVGYPPTTRSEHPPYSPHPGGHSPYPTGNSLYPNGHSPYPTGNSHPSGHPQSTGQIYRGGHPVYHSHSSSNVSGTSFSSLPVHQSNSIPLGNPYSMHPPGHVYNSPGSVYNSPGQPYYPQQPHVFGQPAAQPFVPGQAIIMMPGQQDSGRGFGQMVKEALVFSTINAGINRLINPHTHHYVENKPAETAPSTTTHITYNNQYFNTEPGATNPTNVPSASVPGSNPPLSGTFSPTVGPNSGPTLGNGNTYIPNISGNTVPALAGVSNSGGTNTGVIGATSGVHGNVSAATTSNAPNDQNNLSGYPSSVDNVIFNRISDKELFQITEELFAKSSLNVSKYLKLNLQKRVTSSNVTDEAKEPLFYVDPLVLDYPTIHTTRSLYDSYGHDFRKKVNRTVEIRKQEDLLIDTFLNTNVMSTAMDWLADHGFIDPDDFERKDVLRRIWFTMFSGSTCGFERVFASENYETAIIGVQDWIYFENQESLKRIDYMGYVDKLDLGNSSSLVKLNFQMDGVIRQNATIFVGTLPELEMALYTICFYARSNNLCPVLLGGTKFDIYTHSFIYFGNEVIDLGLPMF